MLGNRTLKPEMAVMFITDKAFRNVSYGLSLLQRGRLSGDHDPGIHMLNKRNWRKQKKVANLGLQISHTP